MFDNILKLIKVAFLGAFVAVTCSLIVTTTEVVRGLPGQVDHQAMEARKELADKVDSALDAAMFTLNQQGDATRLAAVRELRATREQLVGEIDSTRVQVAETVKASLALADRHAVAFENRLDETNGILSSTAKPIAGVVAQVNAAAPDFLDCDHNPDCVFNRYVGVARATERSAIAIEKALPILTLEAEQTGQHVNRIAGSVDLFVQRVTAPQPLWKTILGVARDAGTAGRMFMP